MPFASDALKWPAALTGGWVIGWALTWLGWGASTLLLLSALALWGWTHLSQRFLRGHADGGTCREADSWQLMAGLLSEGVCEIEDNVDGQQRCLYANERMGTLLGVSTDAMLTNIHGAWCHLQVDDWREAMAALTHAVNAVRRGAPQRETESLCRWQKDGQVRWLLFRARVVGPSDGQLQAALYIHLCVKDTTADRQHQKFCQDVLDGYPAPVRIRDLAGRHLLTNPAFDRLHQLRPGESLGKLDRELLPLDVQIACQEADARLAHTGLTQVFEHRLAGAGGSRTYQVTQFLLRKEDGEPYASCSIHTDVSVRRAAQDRLQRILDAAPVGVAVTSDGVVRYVNRCCSAMLEVREGDPTPPLYVDPTERERLTEQLQRHGEVLEHRMQMWRGPAASGQIRDLVASFIRTDFDGRPAVLAWLVDVTDMQMDRPAPLPGLWSLIPMRQQTVQSPTATEAAA